MLSPEELIKLLELKDSEITAKDNELKTSSEVIGELKTELSAKEEELLTASDIPTVKVGKDTYQIVIPGFHFYNQDERTTTFYTTRDVQKDDKLAAALVKMGSGVLLKVEKKK